MKTALAGFALLTLAGAVSGDCRSLRSYSPSYQSYNYPVALFAEYAAYGVAWEPQADEATQKRLERLEKLLEAMLSQSKGGAPANNKDGKALEARQSPAPALKDFVTNCASCHDKGTSKKGGGFAFLEGDDFTNDDLDVIQIAKMAARLAAHTMPPKKQVDPEARKRMGSYLSDVLDSIKAEDPKGKK